jgi:hypothetical protein
VLVLRVVVEWGKRGRRRAREMKKKAGKKCYIQGGEKNLKREKNRRRIKRGT